jgi:hypothetical protein
MQSNKQTSSEPKETHHEVMQAQVGFDEQDPQIPLIVGFGIASVICVIVVVLGIQAYFDHEKAQQVYQQVWVPVAENYRQLRTAEDEGLNSYKYDQQDKTVVHIPIKRAMELLAKEAAENKLQYFQKEYPVKVPGADVPSNGTGSNTNGATSSTVPSK